MIIWTKIEGFKNIELSDLPVYDNKYKKTKIRTYNERVYINFRSLILLEYDIECESFTMVSVDSLPVYKNIYFIQLYLDNCAYKIETNQMKD